MTKDKVISLFKILRNNDPEPVTELTFKSHYQLLVAVILSAQATDKSVNAATSKLFKDAPTPEKIFKLGVRKLKTYIKTIGLYNAKAINVVATSEIIWKEYKNKIPRTREELMKLPGVGRKTANVVLNNAFGQHTHHWLIILGRYTCIARKPKCYDCRVQKLCPFKPKTKNT